MQIRQKISIFMHKKKYFSLNLHISYDYNIILNYTIPKIKGEVNHFSVMNFAVFLFYYSHAEANPEIHNANGITSSAGT